jgi:hypothetical protein
MNMQFSQASRLTARPAQARSSRVAIAKENQR